MIQEMSLQVILEFLKSVFVAANPAHGITLMKFKASFKVALFMSPMIMLVEKLQIWAIANSAYVAIVLSAIAIDHLLGSVRHSRLFDDDFEWKQNARGLFVKLLLVVMVGILFEELHHLAGEFTLITEYTITIARVTVFFYPFSSAMGNARVISNGKFPPRGLEDKLTRWLDDINKK